MGLLDLPSLVLDIVFDRLEAFDFAPLPPDATVAAYSTTPALDTHVQSNLCSLSLCSKRAHDLCLPRLFRHVSLVDRPLHHLLYAVQVLLPKYGQLVRALDVCHTIYFVEHRGLDPHDAEIRSFLQSEDWGSAAYLIDRFHPRSLPAHFSKDHCHAIDLLDQFARVPSLQHVKLMHDCADESSECNTALRQARSGLIVEAIRQCPNVRAVRRIGTRLIQIADVLNAPGSEAVSDQIEKSYRGQLARYELYDFKWNGFSNPLAIPRHLAVFRDSLTTLVLRDSGSGSGGDIDWDDALALPRLIASMPRLQSLTIESPSVVRSCCLITKRQRDHDRHERISGTPTWRCRLRALSLPNTSYSHEDVLAVASWISHFQPTLEHLSLRTRDLNTYEPDTSSALLASFPDGIPFPRLRTLVDRMPGLGLDLAKIGPMPSLERLELKWIPFAGHSLDWRHELKDMLSSAADRYPLLRDARLHILSSGGEYATSAYIESLEREMRGRFKISVRVSIMP